MMILPVYIKGILFANATNAQDNMHGIAVTTRVCLGPIASITNPPINDPPMEEIDGIEPEIKSLLKLMINFVIFNNLISVTPIQLESHFKFISYIYYQIKVFFEVFLAQFSF